MKVTVGNKQVSLSKSDYLAEGGEGAIYVKDNLAFKLYSDPCKMIPDGKIQELSALTMPNIIKPEDAVYDSRGIPIGYSMRFVKDTHALCQVFTKAFKKRNGIKPKNAIDMIENMRRTLSHIHENGILVVDFNEMNFLVDNRFSEIFFIDVDSYQTPNYRATALMESVRDRHSKLNHFDQGTDWFAFAVVSFQLMSGIHPYKGKHPKYSGFEDRMVNNISVFNPDVKVPKSVSDYDKLIPGALKEWYRKVFEETLRCPPPIDFVNDIVSANTFVVQTISSSDAFVIELLSDYEGDITDYFYHRGNEILIAGDKVVYGSFTKHCKPGIQVGYIGHNAFTVWREQETLIVDNFVSGRRNEFEASDFMVSDGRIYYKNMGNIMEIKEISGRLIPQMISTTMENATKMFPGVSLQNMLGKLVATYFPDSGIQYQLKLEQLSKYKIVDAKMERGILVIIGSQKGKYDKFIFSIKEGKIISERKVEDISYNGINMAVLDRGIAVMITAEEDVEIFSSDNVNKVKVIQDPNIHSDMRLQAKGGKIVFCEGRKLYKLEMNS